MEAYYISATARLISNRLIFCVGPTEHHLHRLGMHSLLQCKKVVHSYFRKVRMDKASGQAFRHSRRVERTSHIGHEYDIGAAPLITDEESALDPLGAMPAKSLNGDGGQVHCTPTGSALTIYDNQSLSALSLQRASHSQRAGIQVEVIPT